MISIRDLRKEYNQGGETVVALNGISLEIGATEFVSIMGSSGSGKSTMMNVLGCLDNQAGGEYFLDNINIIGA
ncbi:MAG: ATP-binding cassette domain-containing protein, partial [Coprobacillaceae bacterium]